VADLPSPLVNPTFRDDLPRYPGLLQICRVVASSSPPYAAVTVPGPVGSPPPNLYAAYTEQVRTDTLLPRDRETCVVDDLTGAGLTPGYYGCRLVGSYTVVSTVSAGITGSPSSQVITPASMAGILPGMAVLVDVGTSQEQSIIIAVGMTSFSAVVLGNHPAKVQVVGVCPLYAAVGSSQTPSVPVMTGGGAPTTTPAVGTYPLIFNITTGILYQWNGTAWVSINTGTTAVSFAKVYSYANQAIDGILQVVSFDTRAFDTGSYTSVGLGPWTYFTAPATGVYRVVGCAVWSIDYVEAPTAICCQLQIFVNDSQPIPGTGFDTAYITNPGHDDTTTAFCAQTAAADGLQLNAGDQVALYASQAYQEGGEDVVVSLSGSGSGGNVYFFIQRLA
jgi:hypothetical protein